MILGTAAYMSPEQARGQSVDKRTDIWAFGCVLYEMLTGRSAFARDTLSDTIAAILERQPDWTALPGDVPAGAERVLRRCLEKDPRNRLRDIGNARIDLNERATAVTTRPQVSTSQLVIGGALSVALVVGAMTGLQMAPDPPVSQSADPVRFSFAAPDGLRVQGVPAPSPDGRQIAFVGRDADGKSSLWIRSMDSGEPRRIEGTDGADGPFWSPDGQFVGFGVSSEGRLKRADVRGGPVMNTSRMSDAFLGATWNQNGVVLLAPDSRVPLLRVPASGGTPQPVTVLDSTRRENSHRWPHFLPDGRHFLYTARSDVRENTGIYVGSLDSNDRTWLVEAQSRAVYAPPGYLLFVREGTLLAQPFDASTLRLSGEPVALAGNVAQNPTGASASFSVSPMVASSPM
jgi:hypothetical protein